MNERDRQPKKERLSQLYKGARSGYCRICGEYKELTKDHFPPQNTGNNELVLIESQSTTIPSQNGMKFRTICRQCNGELLGDLDDEQKALVTQFRTYPRKLNVYAAKYIGTTLDSQRLLRSVLGHYIGICFGDDVSKEIQKPLSYSAFYEEIRQFVLGNVEAPKGIQIYYWYYPYDDVRVSQFQAMMPLSSRGSMAPVFGGVVKYYPSMSR